MPRSDRLAYMFGSLIMHVIRYISKRVEGGAVKLLKVPTGGDRLS